MHTPAKISQQSIKSVMTTERAASMARTTMAPVLPGRPVPPVFRKVHDFADILDIRRRDKDKMIKLPERYRYLPEHAGAIRATVLAGLNALPTGPVIAPAPPPTVIPTTREFGTPPLPVEEPGVEARLEEPGVEARLEGAGVEARLEGEEMEGAEVEEAEGASRPGRVVGVVEANNRLGKGVPGAQIYQEKGTGKENRERYWTIQW